jgi:hypothetical protein
MAMAAFITPNATLAASMKSEKFFTSSLTGASNWPGVRLTPTPSGWAENCVPCTTDSTPCSARAVAKLMSARLRPASTCVVAGASMGASQAQATASARQSAAAIWRVGFMLAILFFRVRDTG